MRQPEYGRRLSWTVVLIIANAIIFVLELVLSGNPHSFSIENKFFALSKEGLEAGFVWQLLTFQFMHAGLLHLLFNCWAIYLFGQAIEEVLGWRKFVILYLSSGVVGGICQVLVALVWPDLFGGPVVGASAGGFGLMAAYAVLFPERELTLLFPPVTFHAKTLLIFSAVLALAFIVFPIDHVANAAHLGGMLTGVVFVRQFIQGRGLRWGGSPDSAVPRLRVFARSRPGKAASWRSTSGPPNEGLSTDDFLKSEVDPILDKISQHGIQSLTERERQTLEHARKKMTRS